MPSSALADHEKRIVQLVCQGMSREEIAQELHISPKTVKNYLYQIFPYYGVHSRADLVVAALQSGDATILPETPFPLDNV